MKVIDILKYAIEFVNLGDLLKTNLLNGSSLPTECQTSNFKTLINCVNLVNNQIASEYYPLINEKEILSNGEINYSDIAISSIIFDIIKIEKNGVKIDFECFPNKIKTEKGQLKISYSINPPVISDISQTINFPIKLNERIFAYGVAAEYFFLNNLYDDATMWDNRFKTSLMQALRKKTSIYIKARKWV